MFVVSMLKKGGVFQQLIFEVENILERKESDESAGIKQNCFALTIFAQ